jgi:DNA-binding winged helix-turn-helix (wHTH) protein/Tol biopolymer transport system component
MSVNSLSSIVRFGGFELDLQTGELRHAGQKVKLQEQPFQVLATLLEHPGKIVTREELRSKLWPEDTFVDFDHSLNAAIKRLRDALGESADAPVFIETLARRGYRFIAPVNGSSPSNGIEIPPLPSESLFLTHRTVIGCIALLIIASLVWAMWRLPSRHTDIIERKLTSNSSENSVNSASISPDGKYLAYSDNTGLYLKLIRTGEVHSMSLPAKFAARVDDWFPDGSRLLVSRRDELGRASLWSISVFGGSPHPLAADAFGGSVSPDGAHIAFRRADVPYHGSLSREQWVMRSDGADQMEVAADKSDGTAFGPPTWSPDGKRIAYFRTKWFDRRTSSVELNDWQNARAETLFSDGRLTPALHWLPDGLIYGLEDQRDSSLWMVPLQRSGKISGSPKRVTQGQGLILHITGSADGKIISFLSEHWSASVYIGELAPDGAHLLANRRLTLDESENNPYSWTPDSKTVLFTSDRNGTDEIFKQSTDQPLAENLMAGAQNLWQPRLTPDGSEILYISTPQSSSPETLSSIFAIPITGGTPRLVLQDISIRNVQCARLPSTICLYGISTGDTWKAFRFDVKSGKSTAPPQIDPPCNWSLSPDGSQRAVVTYNNYGVIHLRSTSTGKTRDLVVKGWDELKAVDWSADGKSLLVSWLNHDRLNHDLDSALLRVALDGRASVLLRARNDIWAIPSPDGRLLAMEHPQKMHRSLSNPLVLR